MKLVIFDCDGTIVDSQNGIVTAMNFAFDACDLTPPSRRAILDIVGLSLHEVFEVLAPDVASPVRSRLLEGYRDAFTSHADLIAYREPLFAGARDVIERLARREDIILGIATGKSIKGVDRLFAREGFGAHFLTVQTSDNHPSKPHPAMIETAMREVGAAPDETVMIGDTTYDIEMAMNAGVSALGVAWGYHPREWLVKAGAAKIVQHYDEVIEQIDLLLGQGRAGT